MQYYLTPLHDGSSLASDSRLLFDDGCIGTTRTGRANVGTSELTSAANSRTAVVNGWAGETSDSSDTVYSDLRS
jgi:hypothetical protein